MQYRRNIEPKLLKAIKRSPVVLLTGARQTGKTTLVRQARESQNHSYVSFDDLRTLSLARHNPIGFIKDLPKPVIIDEVQRIPEIFLAIKQDVDLNRVPGRYLLTGSANPLLVPRLSDSLAGRMEIIELFPLSQGELNGITETFIDTGFAQSVPQSPHVPMPRADLYQKIITGGYPLVQNIDEDSREAWFNSYTDALLQKDVQDLSHISGITQMPHLLQFLAVRAGSLLNVAELSRSSGIAISTLHRYLALLKTLFLVDFLLPWSNNLNTQLVKSPKTYLLDSGLLSYLLGLQLERALKDGILMGHILESFVWQELTKQATWCKTRTNFFHMRTSSGIEVDFVLENHLRQIIAIEVKSSETVQANDFKGLRYLQERMGKDFLQGFLLYLGTETIPFGNNLRALPISSLWTVL